VCTRRRLEGRKRNARRVFVTKTERCVRIGWRHIWITALIVTVLITWLVAVLIERAA
ncbi:MAG: hypothetical protein HYX81_03555, partial [Chloroflexi bacterium]|nr:hypothetical protein [Chloroflexota bacterium]